jgi:alpha-1,2-mannosyltransferase
MTYKLTLPAPRDDIYSLVTVAGLSLFLSVELAYFLLSDPPSFHMPSVDAFGGTAIGRDFLNTWMGGRSALADGPSAWFDFRVYNNLLSELVGVTESYFWSYPPHILLFIWPFGLLPYLLAFALWTVLGLALFVYVASLGGVERKHLLFIAVAPAVTINAIIGQNGFFAAALLIGGLANLDRRPVLSGVLFGILTIKPQLGLLLPLVLAVTGRWRTILSAATTTVVLVSATAWLYGADIWTAYLQQVVPQQHYLQEHGADMLFLQIPSAFYAARLVGLSSASAWAVQALVSAAAIAAVTWTFWHRREPVLSMALLITATFLVTPYSLNYDMVVLGWILALLRQRQNNEPADHYLIVAVWLLPVAMMLAGLIYVPLAVFVLLAFAVRLLWQLVRSEVPRDRVAPATAQSGLLGFCSPLRK